MDDAGIPKAFSLVSTTVTLTDRAGRFKSSYVGLYVRVAGATSGGNNGIFKITGNRGDNFQHLIDICAYRSFPRCKIEQSFLELCRFLPGLGGQAAMLASTAHGALVAVAQLEVDAVEIFPTQGLGVRRKVGGRG
jgi:hypothetical protein